MGQKHRPREREGRIVTRRCGERWGAQLEVEERQGEQISRLRIDLPGLFASEASAASAGRGALGEWRAGRVTVHDLVLRELAATYRRLREQQQPMEPAAVPTTGTAWDRTLALWELAGWLDAADAARYREHARRVFDAAAATVKRHRLSDLDSDPAS